MRHLMRGVAWLVVALSVAGGAVCEGAQVRSGSWSFGGVERTYWVSTPDTWDQRTPLPLVLILHPFGSSGQTFLQSSGWLDVSDRHGVLVVSPDGSRSAGNGAYTWNSYTFDGSGPDDLGFLAGLPAEVGRQLPVSETRVYVTGFSNGAMMASSLACVRNRAFAAFAPVAGGWLSAYGGSEAPCTPDAPVDIWLWRGERETQVTGTSNPQPRNVQDAAQRDFWVAHNGGGMPVSITETIPLDGRTATHRTDRWSEAAATWFTEVAGASHQYFPGAAERIWSEFFAARQREVGGPATPVAGSHEYAWVRFGTGVARGVAQAPNGDVWVAGSYTGSLDLGGRRISSRGKSDAFVARLDQAGNVFALRSLGAAESDFAADIAISDSGRVFVTGGFVGSLGEGSPSLAVQGRLDTFVAELDSAGSVVAAYSAGGVLDDYGNEVDARNGRIAIGINAKSALTLPGLGAMPYSSGDEGYVALLDEQLRALSAHQIGGMGAASVRGVALGQEVIAFVGECAGDLQLFGIVRSCDGATDGFIARVSTGTGQTWVRFVDGAGLQSLRGVGIDAYGDLTALGRFDDTALLDQQISLRAAGGKDLLVWRVDGQGRTLGAFAVGSSGEDEGGEVAVSSTGTFSIAGHFRGMPSLKGVSLASTYQGGGDEFVLSYSRSGELIGLSRGGGAGSEAHYAMAESALGNVTVGTYSGNTRFGDGTSSGEGFYIAGRRFVPMTATRSAGRHAAIPQDAERKAPEIRRTTRRTTQSMQVSTMEPRGTH